MSVRTLMPINSYIWNIHLVKVKWDNFTIRSQAGFIEVIIVSINLDFFKTFDLGHMFSLRNLNSKTSAWIKTWLNREVSNHQHTAAARVPPQPFFAPMLFSVFINDLEEGIKPSLLLSAGEIKLGEQRITKRVGHSQTHGTRTAHVG